MAPLALHSSSKQVSVLPLLLVFLFFHTTSASVSLNDYMDLLRQVCTKTLDAALCFQALSSDGRIVDGELKTFATVAVELALANATDIERDVELHLQKTKDPATIGVLTTCSVMYQGITNDLLIAMSDFNSGIYSDVNSKTSHIQRNIDACEKAFPKFPGEKGMYTLSNQIMKVLTDIVTVIANLLSESG